MSNRNKIRSLLITSGMVGRTTQSPHIFRFRHSIKYVSEIQLTHQPSILLSYLGCVNAVALEFVFKKHFEYITMDKAVSQNLTMYISPVNIILAYIYIWPSACIAWTSAVIMLEVSTLCGNQLNFKWIDSISKKPPWLYCVLLFLYLLDVVRFICILPSQLDSIKYLMTSFPANIPFIHDLLSGYKRPGLIM